MPERLDKLRETLAELEAELDSLESLDEPTRAVLFAAKQDIEQTLAEHQDPADWDWDPQTVVDNLSEATQEFEVSHPTLTGIVQRVINALTQLGI